MPFLRIFVVAAVVYFIYVVVRHLRGGAGQPRFQCAKCKSCVKMFDDGVMCRFKGRETFKNETHISNCIDYVKK